MRPRISVLTPTIPGRESLLKECVASVEAQTHQSYEHLVLLDKEYNGCSATMNALAGMAKGEFLFILADDDLIFPGCLSVLDEAQRESGADVVYSPPLVWGEDGAQFRREPPGIPAVALIRTSLWRTLRGYNVGLKAVEDRDFFERAIGKKAHFYRADKHPTWLYRFHGGNKSRS